MCKVCPQRAIELPVVEVIDSNRCIRLFLGDYAYLKYQDENIITIGRLGSDLEHTFENKEEEYEHQVQGEEESHGSHRANYYRLIHALWLNPGYMMKCGWDDDQFTMVERKIDE